MASIARRGKSGGREGRNLDDGGAGVRVVLRVSALSAGRCRSQAPSGYMLNSPAKLRTKRPRQRGQRSPPGRIRKATRRQVVAIRFVDIRAKKAPDRKHSVLRTSADGTR